MVIPSEKKPMIKAGWLRVLLFCLVGLLSTMVLAFGIGKLIDILKKDSPAVTVGTEDQVFSGGGFLWLTVLGSLLLSLIVVFIFRKFIDRKPFVSLGLVTRGFGFDALSGLFLAPTLLGSGAIILFLTRHLDWTDINLNGSELFIELGILMMVAFSEELVFRGYILNNLMESFNKWVALLISAALFTISHLDNPGIDILPVANIFFAGILLGINYIYTKNLWFAVLFHLGWNFFQGPILGFGVSGLNLSSLLQTELKGDLSITGGDFGFEGSIIATALTFITIVLLYLVYEKKYGTAVKA
jgi:membrane protease YdiL (CAAX protease family)